MKYEVAISDEAAVEIHVAYDWLEERNPQAALLWYAKLSSAIASLESMPERNPRLAAGSRTRKLLCGRYRIEFEIADDTVTIARVIHGARGEP